MDNGDDSSPLNVERVRRFAMATGAILLVYVLAGGKLKSELHISLIDIQLSRARLILLFMIIVSLYATLRYWYYGIKLPLSRSKVRSYLKTRRSLLIYKGSNGHYQDRIQNSTDIYAGFHADLESRVPAGSTPFDFIIFTDAITEPNEGYIRRLAANRVAPYFSEIMPDEISLENEGRHAWGSVGALRWSTRFGFFLEELDIWAPIIINVIGLLVFVPYVLLTC